jgi:hypothetical protein
VVAARFEAPGPLATPTGVRPSLVAALFATLGTAAVFWPASLLPPTNGDPELLHNLWILRTMLRLEGIGLWGLALLAWRFPMTLDSLRGDAILVDHPGKAFVVLLAVHIAGVLLFLPPQQIVSSDPLFTADHATHLYRAFAARALFRETGHLDGFDPFINAGVPWVLQPDARGFEWFAVLFPWLGLAALSKIWVLGIEALVPLCLWGSARWGGLDRRATWFVVLLGLVYWHAGRPFLGYYRWNGDYGYLLACLVALFVTALAVRFLTVTARRRRRLLLLLWPLLALTGYAHPLGLLLPLVPLMLLLIWSTSSVSRIERFALALVPLSLVFLHARWMIPLIQQRTGLPLPSAGLRLHGVADLLPLLHQVGVLPLLAILVLAIAGALVLRQRHGLLLVAMAGMALTCLALVVWGYATPGVRRFETARFLVPAMLASCLLAGPGAAAMTAWLRPRLGAPLVLLLLIGASTVPAFAAVLDTRFFYVHRIHAVLDDTFPRLMLTVQEGPGPNARLLFESTRPGWMTTDRSDGALEALVPLFTHRQVLGLSNAELTRRDLNLSFGQGQLASHPFSTWTRERFASFLRCYDVGTIVAWSEDAQGFLSRFPDQLEAPRSIDDIQVFRVRNWHSSLEGEAQMSVGYAHVELRDIRTDEILLPLHWQSGLRTSPPVALHPVTVPGAVAPMIGIRPGPHDFVLLHP